MKNDFDNYFKEKEPLLDEVTGRRLKGPFGCPPYNKKHPTWQEMDQFFGGVSYE